MPLTSVAPVAAYRSMADDLAAALDPVMFANRAGITPDAWQSAVMRSQAQQQILCCSRQAGKSTTTAIIAMHQALYVPGSLVLLLAPVGRQSKELLSKVRTVYHDAASDMEPEADNQVTLELDNGSRVVVIPAKAGNIRGFSAVSLVIADEAAWIPDDVYMAIRPMLAVSQGRIILLSTPFGKRGFFYREWTEGGTDWSRTKITAYDCPRIDPVWLAAERRRIPAPAFAQEYECVFGEADDAAFRYEDIQAALSPGIAPLFPQRTETRP